MVLSVVHHRLLILMLSVPVLVLLRMSITRTREGSPTPTRKLRNSISMRMVRPVRLFVVAHTLVVELLVSIATRAGRKERDRVVRDAWPPPRPPLLRAQGLPQGVVVREHAPAPTYQCTSQ